MLLYELSENQTGVISAIHIDGAFRKRLKVMGFCEGEPIQCLKKAALSSPVLYRIKGYDVALRKSDAVLIEVRV